jgi:hypothetical protein
MFDLTVVAQGGRWLLCDDEQGELCSFATRAEALEAVEAYARIDDEARYVLIQETPGEWLETIVDPPRPH